MTTLMTLEPIGATPVDVANYGRRWWILAVLGIAQLMVILTPTTVQAALLHSYTTAFLWSALIFVIGADHATTVDPESHPSPRVHVHRVRTGAC